MRWVHVTCMAVIVGSLIVVNKAAGPTAADFYALGVLVGVLAMIAESLDIVRRFSR